VATGDRRGDDGEGNGWQELDDDDCGVDRCSDRGGGVEVRSSCCMGKWGLCVGGGVGGWVPTIFIA
jgi:hypothetical protein